MKRLICVMLILTMLFAMTGCGKTRSVHCDSCGKEVAVKEDSNMTDEWIVYCGDCNEKLFGGTLVQKAE